MRERRQRVSAGRFVLVAELLEQAFPKARATPDYLSHDAERAEQALLSSLGNSCTTSDESLAELLALKHRV